MMSEENILIAKLTGAIVDQLNMIEDPVDREASIYASLCILKEDCGEHFEKALIYLLREGIKP